MEAAIMMHRPGKWGKTRDVSEAAKWDTKKQTHDLIIKKYLYILTGDELKDARDGEPLSFAEGEELSHKHKDAQDGEYAS